MDSVQRKVDNGQRTVYNGKWTMYNGKWTMYNGKWTMYNGQRTYCLLYIVHCTLSTVHCPLYIVHCTLSVEIHSSIFLYGISTIGISISTRVPVASLLRGSFKSIIFTEKLSLRSLCSNSSLFSVILVPRDLCC